MKATTLWAVCKWVYQTLGVKENMTEITNDMLKSYLWMPLKNRLSKYFTSPQETDKFLVEVSNAPADYEAEPYRDIEQIYRRIENRDCPGELWQEMLKCLKENRAVICQNVVQGNQSQASGVSGIGVQHNYGPCHMEFHY